MIKQKIYRNLIFDVGFHKGEDTAYYLYKGFNVIAIDADISLIENGKVRFYKEIENGRLRFLNRVITEDDNKPVTFNISENSQWSSIYKEISQRENMKSYEIKIESARLDTLFKKYGVPYYCKIDIEGNDIVALKTLSSLIDLPIYISVETECCYDYEIAEIKKLDTLNYLYKLGYRKFKLVDQYTLTVLSNQDFYIDTRNMSSIDKYKLYFKDSHTYAKKLLDSSIRKDGKQKFNDIFKGSSGPFGKDLAGKWFDYNGAKELLLKHRKANSIIMDKPYGFWCDWHATF